MQFAPIVSTSPWQFAKLQRCPCPQMLTYRAQIVLQGDMPDDEGYHCVPSKSRKPRYSPSAWLWCFHLNSSWPVAQRKSWFCQYLGVPIPQLLQPAGRQHADRSDPHGDGSPPPLVCPRNRHVINAHGDHIRTCSSWCDGKCSQAVGGQADARIWRCVGEPCPASETRPRTRFASRGMCCGCCGWRSCSVSRWRGSHARGRNKIETKTSMGLRPDPARALHLQEAHGQHEGSPRDDP